MNTTYVPGVCNIGEAEINQRKQIGWLGLLVSALYLLACWYFNLAPIWREIVVIPAAMSATGFLQGFMQFCAGYGMQGVFNFSTELRKTDTVAQAEFRAKDRATARKIFLWSIAIGIAVAVLAYFL